ncbi:hypothetical protein M427DRAFT_34236 [Gonapodya prolifera JEL478]|uniref:Uncharacterized protein n=1 Tax=Gonapodya prolifera (strain JEL478) TaxID=1344416 RepID=A0A139A8R1_GONPJ|nr:hypothetical protein M427DRAFT_34236 [Gonapodya prolifera JEL478]|eukprot:KXS13191.1 hypothetical protein M427DRAFT_34236 [Gonapodya prolifera JEL478]
MPRNVTDRGLNLNPGFYQGPETTKGQIPTSDYSSLPLLLPGSGRMVPGERNSQSGDGGAPNADRAVQKQFLASRMREVIVPRLEKSEKSSGGTLPSLTASAPSFVATITVTCMMWAVTLSLAELVSALPFSGGPGVYAHTAFSGSYLPRARIGYSYIFEYVVGAALNVSAIEPLWWIITYSTLTFMSWQPLKPLFSFTFLAATTLLLLVVAVCVASIPGINLSFLSRECHYLKVAPLASFDAELTSSTNGTPRNAAICGSLMSLLVNIVLWSLPKDSPLLDVMLNVASFHALVAFIVDMIASIRLRWFYLRYHARFEALWDSLV